MLPFHTFLLRTHFAQTRWDEDAFFSALTRPTAAVLDFSIPDRLSFGLASSSTPGFHNEIAGSLLPVLSGSLSYLALSPPLHPGSATPSVLEQTDVFHLLSPPRPPQTDEIWLGGRRVDRTPFLAWGRVNLPEWKVEGVGCRRLSDRVMGLMAFVHSPPEKGKAKGRDGLVLQAQHANGRWGGEYSYSVTDGLFGFRTLYSFAPPADPAELQQGEEAESQLRGRFSVGLESYLSLKQKSAGLSFATRYLTPALLDATTPPSISTLLFSPLIGHISTSYLSSVSPALTLGSRYEFNVYSYESDWTLGGEWKIGAAAAKKTEGVDELGILKARCSTTGDVNLVYLSKLGSMSYEVGVRADVRDRARPIKGVGLELKFCS